MTDLVRASTSRMLPMFDVRAYGDEFTATVVPSHRLANWRLLQELAGVARAQEDQP